VIGSWASNWSAFQKYFSYIMATSFSGGRSRFSNISAISWRPVLVVEEAEYPERTTDHGQATGKLYHLQL